jgi:DNA modification methylase
VLDPFGGSGTTGIVADELGRDAILIELSPDYAAMPARRLAKHMAKLEKIRRKAARELSRRYLGAGVKHIPPLPGQLDMLA